jgi:uncharacterized membrane-anchored protein
MVQKLKSERVVLAAPLSFDGSRARIWRITINESSILKWLLLVPVALILIAFSWFAVLIWYVIFGLWLVPYRLFRRGQRKEKKRELQHRELIESAKNRQE